MTGIHGWSTGATPLPLVLSITATADDTDVTLQLSSTGEMEAAGTIAATPGGSTVSFTLAKAGDVASIVGKGADKSDFSGSIVQATKPVQVISSVPCINVPSSTAACDHAEDTVMPAEAFGKKYVIATPTGAYGKPAAHVVRLFGNQDGTKLTYESGCRPRSQSPCRSSATASIRRSSIRPGST